MPIHESGVTPSQNMPFEDDELPGSSHSDSSTLLEDGMHPEDVHYERRSVWERLVCYIRPSHSKQKRLQSEATDCLHCEKKMVGRRKASRRCMKLGVGILLLL